MPCAVAEPPDHIVAYISVFQRIYDFFHIRIRSVIGICQVKVVPERIEHFPVIITPVQSAVVQQFVFDPARDADDFPLGGLCPSIRRDEKVPEFFKIVLKSADISHDDRRDTVVEGGCRQHFGVEKLTETPQRDFLILDKFSDFFPCVMTIESL